MESSSVVAGTEDQYFSGLWLQRKDGKIVSAFQAKKCSELFEEDNVSWMFWEQVKNEWCPDMQGAKALI